MAWLGFLTLITIYWCIFTAAVSGRLEWWVICVWLMPIFAMSITYQTGMEINGLMVLICIALFLICRRGLSDIRMWNIKRRSRHPLLFGLLYLLVFAMFLYSFAQAQLHGYMLNVQGWGSERQGFWPLFLTLMPMIPLNWVFTELCYTALDRVYLRKEGLLLLSCQCFITNERGVEKGIQQGYFLEGIQNGITYHFRMTRRSFFMLKKEPFLRLQTRVGIFGGRYVTELESADYLKRIRRMDRQDAKIGCGLFVPVLAVAIWLFWFRV